MRRFIFTSFCLLTFMVFSVSYGMKFAENGIEKLKGNVISERTSLVKGEDISHDLSAKRLKLEKLNSFNLFSFMGNELADGISEISKQMVHLVVK